MGERERGGGRGGREGLTTGLVNYLASIGSLPSYQAPAEVSHTCLERRDREGGVRVNAFDRLACTKDGAG